MAEQFVRDSEVPIQNPPTESPSTGPDDGTTGGDGTSGGGTGTGGTGGDSTNGGGTSAGGTGGDGTNGGGTTGDGTNTGSTSGDGTNGSSAGGDGTSGGGAGGGDTGHAPIVSAGADVGESGLQIQTDALGHDLADVSVGLSALGSPLGSPVGLLDGLLGGDTAQGPFVSVDADAGNSGLQVQTDALGHDLADVSVALAALDSPLGLLDDPLRADSGGSSMNPLAGAPLLSVAVNADDMSGVQAAVDVSGNDTIDASIGFGAVEPVLGLADDPQLGLVDTVSGLVDGLLHVG